MRSHRAGALGILGIVVVGALLVAGWWWSDLSSNQPNPANHCELSLGTFSEHRAGGLFRYNASLVGGCEKLLLESVSLQLSAPPGLNESAGTWSALALGQSGETIGTYNSTLSVWSWGGSTGTQSVQTLEIVKDGPALLGEYVWLTQLSPWSGSYGGPLVG